MPLPQLLLELLNLCGGHASQASLGKVGCDQSGEFLLEGGISLAPPLPLVGFLLAAGWGLDRYVGDGELAVWALANANNNSLN